MKQQLASIGNFNLRNLKGKKTQLQCAPPHFTTDHTYLSLVLAAPTLKRVGLQVSDGNEATEVTDVDSVSIRGNIESLVEELGSTVSYLTVSLHLTKPQSSITE